jgi:hypothetical protein
MARDFFSTFSIVLITITASSPILLAQLQPIDAARSSVPNLRIATSGENVYLIWWSNKTGEVLFRVSDDNGASFGDKVNLSNSTDSLSDKPEIAVAGDTIYAGWFETNNQTGAEEPVLRVSNDNGATFGPMLILATNGTLGEATEEEEE